MSDDTEAIVDLNREMTLLALQKLAQKLDAQYGAIQLFVVGGGAIALGYGSRRLTRDIDASYPDSEEIREIVNEVGQEIGLASGWLNSAVDRVSGPRQNDLNSIDILERGLVRISIASPFYLLAMKIAAARSKDEKDIQYLSTLCGVNTLAEALEILEEVFGENPRPIPKDKMEFLDKLYGRSTEWIPRLEPIVKRKSPLGVCGHPMSRGKHGRACVLPSGHRGQHRSKYR